MQNLVRKWGGNAANQRHFIFAQLPPRHYFLVHASGAVALKVAKVPSTVQCTQWIPTNGVSQIDPPGALHYNSYLVQHHCISRFSTDGWGGGGTNFQIVTDVKIRPSFVSLLFVSLWFTGDYYGGVRWACSWRYF